MRVADGEGGQLHHSRGGGDCGDWRARSQSNTSARHLCRPARQVDDCREEDRSRLVLFFPPINFSYQKVNRLKLYSKKRIVRSAENETKLDPVRERIARRAALEFKNGMYGKTSNQQIISSVLFNTD